MHYTGTMTIKDKKYDITKCSNLSSVRIDFYGEPTNIGIFALATDNLPSELACSVYINSREGVVYYYGDYQIYQLYKNLDTSMKFKLFDKEHVLEDRLDVCDEGFKRIYHTLDGDTELLIHEINSVVSYRKVRYGYSTFELSIKNKSNIVTFLKGYDYTKREFTDTTSDTLNRINSFAEISKMKNLDWLSKKNYSLITSIEDFDTLVDTLKNLPPSHPIGFDTETSGLRFNKYPNGHRQRDYLVGICLSWSKDNAIYIPLSHNNITNVDFDYAIKQLKPILETKYLVTHNGIFDYKVMMCYGIKPNICDDTYILERFLSSDDITNKAGLKFLVDKYFNIDQIELSDIFGKSKNSIMAFQSLPYDLVEAYAPADADFTLQLYYLLREKLPNDARAIYGEEIKCLKNLAFVEYHGCRIDMDLMYDAYNRALADVKTLEDAIYTMIGYRLNLNSVDQLSDLLYKRLGCPQVVKMRSNPSRPAADNKAFKFLSGLYLDNPTTKYSDILSSYEYTGVADDGSACVDENDIRRKVLVPGAKLNSCKYPVVVLLREYRDAQKSISNFYTTIEEKTKDNDEGMIFSEYKQMRAATGRIISANINFQQIPNDLKDFVIPYNDDFYVVDADFSQIELRLMVSLANDKELLAKMFDPDNDIHRLICGRIEKKPAHLVTDEERKKAKKYNFGVPYDMGGKSFAELLYGFPINRDKINMAKQVKADYLNSMPRVRDNFEYFRDYAQLNGHITTKFGRYLFLPNLPIETDDFMIARDRRRAGNFPIQGLAADIFKIAFNRVMQRFASTGKEVYCPGLIHDELLLFVNKKHHPYEIIRDLKECMEVKIKGFAPLFTGIAVADSWGEAKNGPYELPIRLADRIAEDARQGNFPKIDGSYKDFIYQEKIEYLNNFFKTYLTEMGFDWEHPEQNNISDLMVNMTNMFFGTEIRGLYKTKSDSVESSIREFVLSETGIDLADTIAVETDKKVTPTTNVVDLSEYFVRNEVFSELYDVEDADEDTSFLDLDEYGRYTAKNTKKELVVDDSLDLFKITVFRKEVYINISDISKEGLQVLTDYLHTIATQDGYFTVKYKFHKDIIDAGINIEMIDRDKIQSILHDYSISDMTKLA